MYNISLNEQVIQAVEKETVHLITEAMDCLLYTSRCV